MVKLPKETQGDFETVPEMTTIAVCYRVIDMGTQESTYKGTVSHKRKIMISWELPEERMTDGRPFSIHKTYTLSPSPKSALRSDLEAWRGKPFSKEEFGEFDIANLIGVPCMAQIVHHVAENGNTYANIAAIMKPPKGVTSKLTGENETIHLDLDAFDPEVFAKLSENLRVRIGSSPEYLEATTNLQTQEGQYEHAPDTPF